MNHIQKSHIKTNVICKKKWIVWKSLMEINSSYVKKWIIWKLMNPVKIHKNISIKIHKNKLITCKDPAAISESFEK